MDLICESNKKLKNVGKRNFFGKTSSGGCNKNDEIVQIILYQTDSKILIKEEMGGRMGDNDMITHAVQTSDNQPKTEELEF